MELYDEISLAQARRDLGYLKNEFGDPQDYCGSFCNTEILTKILMGEKQIKEVIIENIQYYFTNGLENAISGCSSDTIPDKQDLRVQRIIKRYHIEL